jgi:hypothetical protein
LRKEGDREAADEIKALKKPSEPAWAVNQLARGNKREMDGLLRAGERLRDAQQRAMGGGGRDELRAAIAAEREQVGKLVALAEPLLGPRPAPKLERVRAALHAAATDEPTREAIAAGRLVEDTEAIGLGPFALDQSASATPARRPSKPSSRTEKKKKKKKEAPRAEPDTTRRADVAATRKALRALEAARKQERSARERADKARRELGRARDQADEAARALQGAERRMKEAEARAADAGDRLAAAERVASEHA